MQTDNDIIFHSDGDLRGPCFDTVTCWLFDHPHERRLRHFRVFLRAIYHRRCHCFYHEWRPDCCSDSDDNATLVLLDFIIHRTRRHRLRNYGLPNSFAPLALVPSLVFQLFTQERQNIKRKKSPQFRFSLYFSHHGPFLINKSRKISSFRTPCSFTRQCTAFGIVMSPGEITGDSTKFLGLPPVHCETVSENKRICY